MGRVLEEWLTDRCARILRSRSYTFQRRGGDVVVVSRIDFALARGGVECGGLSSWGGLSDHSAIGCLLAVDDLEVVEGSRDAVDWARV